MSRLGQTHTHEHTILLLPDSVSDYTCMYVAYFIRLIIMSYFYYYPDFIVLKFLFL